MTYNVYDLNEKIRMVVYRHLENLPRRDRTFEGLCLFVRYEDDVHRARTEHISKLMATPDTKSWGLPRPTSTYLIQNTPWTEHTPKPMVSPTPRTTVHLMDEKSKEPITTSKGE